MPEQEPVYGPYDRIPLIPALGEPSTDPKVWYQEIAAKFPRLPAQREVELASVIQLGLRSGQMVEEDNINHLLRQSERRLFRQEARAGVLAQLELTYHNLSLVPETVDYLLKDPSSHEQFDWGDLQWIDLVQEGNIKLFTAVRDFDPTRNISFKSYAKFIIYRHLKEAMGQSQSRTQLRGNTQDDLTRLTEIRSALYAELGDEPTVFELAERADLAPEIVADLLLIDRIDVLQARAQNAPAYFPTEDLDAAIEERIRDTANVTEDDAMALVSREKVTAAVRGLVGQLNELSEAIVTFTYGLKGKKLSDEEIVQYIQKNFYWYLRPSVKEVIYLRRIALQKMRSIAPGELHDLF